MCTHVRVDATGRLFCGSQGVYWHWADRGQGESGPQSLAQREVPQWRRDSEYSGKVRVLEWGGISRTTAQWPSRWVALYRGSLYILPSEKASSAPSSYNIWTNRFGNIVCHCCDVCFFWSARVLLLGTRHLLASDAVLSKKCVMLVRRLVKLPEDACGGAKHVLAICLPTVETARAAQDGSSVVLRFSTDTQVWSACTDTQPVPHFIVWAQVPTQSVSTSMPWGACADGQLEEWRTQLYRSQRNMKELAGEADESLAIDFDVDVAASELESEAASTAGGGVLLLSSPQHPRT